MRGPSESCVAAALSLERFDQATIAGAAGHSEAAANMRVLIGLDIASSCPAWVEAGGGFVREVVPQDDAAPEFIANDSFLLEQGVRKTFRLSVPADRLMSGRYRVDVHLDGQASQAARFEFDPVLLTGALEGEEVVAEEGALGPWRDAAPVGESSVPPRQDSHPTGLNLALRGLGGTLESWTSQSNDGSFAAANLIDGRRYRTIGGDPNYCNPCGWRAGNDSFPQDLVFSFHEGRKALLDAVILDNQSPAWMNQGRPEVGRLPKEVEVWVSAADRPEEFSRIAAATLESAVGEQTVRFPPVEARFLKLRILSTQGGSSAQLAEVNVLEAAGAGESILNDLPRDIASPVLGGSVVWFTSDDWEHPVGHLLIPDEKGWKSKDGELPQTFVLAFNEDRRALIDRVVIDSRGGGDPKSQPKMILVSLSEESPLKGFHEVGRMQFSLGEGPQTLPIGEEGRFLRLDIVENHGAKFTSMGRVQVFEGSRPGQGSVLSVTGALEAESSAVPSAPTTEQTAASERESNDDPGSANDLPLGSSIFGTIKPVGDVDYYLLRVPEGERQVLNLNVSGQAGIDLLDLSRTVKHADAGGGSGGQSDFSWLVQPGDYLLRIGNPPASVVLLWDASRSIEGAVEELKHAVQGYVERVPPGVRVNLVRFGGEIQVLLPDFTTDKTQLLAAIEEGFEIGDGSPLYDALAKGLELLGPERGNRALIVLSDGGTQGSYISYSDLWRLLRKEGPRLYTVGFGAALEDERPKEGLTNEDMLRHFAVATGGRFLRAPSAEALAALYGQIADDLHGDPSYSIGAHLSEGVGRLSVAQGEEHVLAELAPRVELVIDASGSMKAPVKGKGTPRKMDLAKEVLREIIDSMPDTSVVALRVYGRRVREGQRGDCQDTELLVPFGPIDKPKLKTIMGEIRPLGTTPLAYSLKKAAEDLSGDAQDRRIVLITDGKEECGGDPAQVVADLRQAGIRAQVDVVGFALGDEASRAAIKRVADVSEGRFFDAQDREGLRESVGKTLALPYDVLDAAGERVARGKLGDETVELPEGVYRVTVPSTAGTVTISDVRIGRDHTTRIRLGRDGQDVVGQVGLPGK